ncbi:unnamed protein product [Darwinula stevensoni]|uniref:Peptidase M13 N-terminal domain-containing protein n=1 Tax=Darwinula stevensoni TaxID=69355 RepID=A0A7R9AGB1_9CRUS|nr:unnamed protein product [Darwinula stevensoni]CAG0903659.1 unnamed protein product [Darwinula stevensoni]
MLFRFFLNRANMLSEAFQTMKAGYVAYLTGSTKTPPRWRFCVKYVIGNLGVALAAPFIRRYYDHESQNEAQELVAQLRDEFQELIEDLSWMDAETQDAARRKVHAMSFHVGFPGEIFNFTEVDGEYDQVKMDPCCFFNNQFQHLSNNVKNEMKFYGKPVNKTRWNVSPTVVNAFYNRHKNQMGPSHYHFR